MKALFIFNIDEETEARRGYIRCPRSDLTDPLGFGSLLSGTMAYDRGKIKLRLHIHFKPYVASGKSKNLKRHKKKREVTHKLSMKKKCDRI